MTPKEKAKQLVDKFHIIKTPHWNKNMDGHITMEQIGFYSAQQCALIAVDEMMEVYASSLVALGHSTEEAESVESPYLKEVKQEIEKL